MFILAIFLMSVLSSRSGAQSSIDDYINVGTVLFSSLDIQKPHWGINEISLLKARRHFQELLPPPNFIDTSDGDYVHILLNYFKDTYSSIKREAACPVADGLMTTALSDALGGYMTLWVLPISKLAFYGGSVSQENIVKLYQFHNEIKRFLETDGKGWRSPDKNILHSITVNTAAPMHITRSMKNPCENFAYYEKSEHGLTIPTPSIYWGEEPGSSSTMFLPLRNQSLIPLDSPNYSNALFKYYDAAKNCMDDGSNAHDYDFDNRFQKWLAIDVVPHLSDDNVYLPLGSVLSLVNKSREMCDKVIDLYNTEPKPQYPHYVIAGIPIDLSSKKILVIGVILILEIAWCIPALIYIFCSKKKKKRESSNIYTLLDACRNKKKKGGGKGDNVFFQKSKRKSSPVNRGFKIGTRPRSGNSELASQFVPTESKGSTMATDTRSYFASGACSGVSVIHETRSRTPLKSSMKKIKSAHTSPDHVVIIPSKSNKTCCSINSQEKCSCMINSRPPTESYTIENNSDPSTVFSSVKQIDIPVNTLSNTTHIVSSGDFIKWSGPNNTQPPDWAEDQKAYPECPCLTCLEAEVGSEITIVNQVSRPEIECADKNVEINMEPMCPLIDQAKCVKKMKNFGLKLESGRPYLEIKIDKPQTEICVGIGGTFDPLKISKRSKIPKRLPKTSAALMSSCTSAMSKEPVATRNKSLIPQPRRRPVDDIDIKPTKPKQKRKDNKLNVTL